MSSRLEDNAFSLGATLGGKVAAKTAETILQELASQIDATTPQNPTQQAEELARVVYREGGFRGNREDYYAPLNSLLADAVVARTGLPITLAVVLIAIGRRVGISVEGIGFPGHFLARVGGEDGVLVDPFNQGHILSKLELDAMATRFLGDPSLLGPHHLAPVDDEAIIVRMLINLQHAYRKRGSFARAMLVSDKLVEVTGSPEHIRDRGLLAIALGSYEIAEGDLSAYLEARPSAKDVPTIAVALEELRKAPAKTLQ